MLIVKVGKIGIYVAMKIFIFIFLFSTFSFANERCIKLIPEIRKAHYFYFGVDFPYHYSVAQAEKESLCRHNIFSTDGVGSEGFAQITFSIWKSLLQKQNIPEIKSISNHAKAQAFINYYNYNSSYCKKLFEMYQIFNGGSLVSKELQKAKSCKWEDGYKVCKRKDVCVWFTSSGCKQWRNACDINYEYSKKIFKFANKYKVLYNVEIYKFW